MRIDFTTGHGHHHDDLADTRNLGWQSVHQNRRRIAGLTTGDIDADPVEGAHQLPKQHVRLIGGQPRLLLLLTMKGLNAISGQLQAAQRFFADRSQSLIQFGRRNLYRRGIELQGIELSGVIEQSPITLLAHLCDNFANDVLDTGRWFLATSHDALQSRFEIGIVKTQKLNHAFSPDDTDALLKMLNRKWSARRRSLFPVRRESG